MRLLSILLFLTGCSHVTGSGSTRVDPIPIKSALKEDSVVLGLPVVVQKKPTGGYRSIVDLQVEIRLTEPSDVDLPLLPNGFVAGARGRW